jgi:uncharacterized protein (UPF0261 family)
VRTAARAEHAQWFDGVLDLTTTELVDELCGGVLSAGPDRLTAAGARGVPQVVSLGALDMVCPRAAAVCSAYRARSATSARATPCRSGTAGGRCTSTTRP